MIIHLPAIREMNAKMKYLIQGFKLLSIFLFASTFIACSDKLDDYNPENYPIADGTFIQDYLVKNWDDAQWQKELTALKEVGMHYLVLAPTLNMDEDGVNRIIYDGSLPGTVVKYPVDLVENCLRNAQKAGLKVFLGLNFDEKWWSAGFSPEWLYEQMELGNQLANELTQRYKNRYKETLHGWYWVWEVDNLNCTTLERQKVLANALNINIDHLSKITPDMPFMLCPFVNYRMGTAEQNREMWINVFAQTHFREGDIFAPQDCVGAGGLEIEMLDEWFKEISVAVKTKPELLFWSDAETFDQRFWTSATLDRFVRQMEVAKPYVSNIITFAYSHYYSPLSANKNFHRSYIEYVETGILPHEPMPEPVGNLTSFAQFDGTVDLFWKEPENKENIVGCSVYRDSILIMNLQYQNQIIDTFRDKNAEQGRNHEYRICTYNSVGVESTPAITVLKTDKE